jgi:hypothetical protein
MLLLHSQIFKNFSKKYEFYLFGKMNILTTAPKHLLPYIRAIKIPGKAGGISCAGIALLIPATSQDA